MHILPCLLTLLLVTAADAADERVAPFIGSWAGTVTTSGSSCEWKVKLVFKAEKDSLRGTFTYSGSGDCPEKPAEGHFNAVPDEGECMKGSLMLQGLPGMNGEACFEGEGSVVFRSAMGQGKLELSEGGRTAELEARSPLGTAEGMFTKLVPKKKRAAAKGKKNAQTKKSAPARKVSAPPAPEVFIGGY